MDFTTLSNLRISISVCNSQSNAVELEQSTDEPAIVKTDQLWWGSTWHMQTPLENIAEDVSIVLRLLSGNGTTPDASESVLTCRFPVNKYAIDTSKTVFYFKSAVYDDKPPGPKAKPLAPASASDFEASLDVDLEIAKFYRDVDVDSL